MSYTEWLQNGREVSFENREAIRFEIFKYLSDYGKHIDPKVHWGISTMMDFVMGLGVCSSHYKPIHYQTHDRTREPMEMRGTEGPSGGICECGMWISHIGTDIGTIHDGGTCMDRACVSRREWCRPKDIKKELE